MVLQHDYFQQNLALLQEHHPKVWQIVMDYNAEPTGEFRLAKDGRPNLLVQTADAEEIFLHDCVDTAAELQNYYRLVPEEATGVAIFMGMGLGYTPQAMLKSRRHLRQLLVFEPETGIFIQALHALDLTTLLTSKQVIIAIGPDINAAEVLAPMTRALRLESTYVLRHTPCFRIAPEAYQNLHDEVYKHGSEFNIDGNTITAYGGKFIVNRLRNLAPIHHQQLLENIQETCTGIPAIIVAGGPSLNKNIHLLTKAKNRAVIIAADTALPALITHGVIPDFTTSIDMQDITLEKIIDVAGKSRETSLVCSTWLTPQVTKNFPVRQVYWTFAAKNMEKWFNDMLGGKMLTGGAGTVAQLNLITAYTLGCSPIVFVGQDLSFSGETGHVQHTSLTSRDNLNNADYIMAEGYGGDGEVKTNRSMLSHKNNLEHAIEAAREERHFINATEGGVRIKGTDELPLRDVLADYCNQELNVKELLRKTQKQGKMPTRRRMVETLTRMLKTINGVKKDMALLEGKITTLSKKTDHLIEQNITCHKFESLPADMQRQIGELDTLNTKLDKAKVWALLDESTIEGLRQSERLNNEIQQLAGQPEKYLEWLRKAIQRFALINQVRRHVLTPFNSQLKTLTNFYRQEDSLLRALTRHKGSPREEAVLKLLRLYHQNGEYVLLEKTIADYFPEPADSAEISFYLGTIAAHRSQFKQMEEHFAGAINLDHPWSAQIDECRRNLAAQYLSFFNHWRQNDRLVANRMLFKASRYTVDSPSLRQTIAAEAADITKMAT
ncbi:MAG TPA: DUF115 domain-containing protein, partial [Desulfobacterales bacterium]|nr:DUF115 domain-containing protein [Desulfobacterales bacterium]